MSLEESLLARRRDRAIAIVLGVKERECDDYLSDDASRKLRKAVLDQFNDLYAFASDLLADCGAPVLNDEYLHRLEAVTAALEVMVDDAG